MFKAMRLDKGWSQEQLSKESGLSVRTIQRIENGHQVNNDSVEKAG